MKFMISDLLDDLQEVDIAIRPNVSASSHRIKELTMKKIQEHGKYETKPKRIGFTRKLLIAAAIITAVAVPAMAVSGISFFDWLSVTKDFQDSILFSAEEMEQSKEDRWNVSGWFVEMWSENVTSTGMILVCNEFSNGVHLQKLTTDESYWLEKWNGTEYKKLEAQVPAGDTLQIQQKTRYQWAVDWSDTYGSLESGYYRIAKTFTSGKTSKVNYCSFRVLTEEMEPYIRKCNDTLMDLLASESWHMTLTDYRLYDDQEEIDYGRVEMEIWRSGEDYLLMDSGYLPDGSVAFRSGSMLRDGKQYANLKRAGDTVESEILEWVNADFIDHSHFDLWPESMNLWEDLVGQVCDNGNQIIAIEYSGPIGGGQSDMTKEEILEIWPYAYHDYSEKTFTFNEQGGLCSIHHTIQTAADVPDEEKVLREKLEIHDTPAEEIAELIAGQKFGQAKSFRYSDDLALYKDKGRMDGFVNTDEYLLDAGDEAIERARKEIDPKKDPGYRDGRVYNCADVFYDADAKIWKVEFWFSQDDDFRVIVYLDENGITQWMLNP